MMTLLVIVLIPIALIACLGLLSWVLFAGLVVTAIVKGPGKPSEGK
jgi:hypothetical protein